jgi:hypothetical protein
MKSEVYKAKLNTRDDLIARIMNSALLLKQERQDYFRRATRTVVKRVEKCIEVDGGIFEHLTLSLLMSYIYIYMEFLVKSEILSSYIYGPTFGNAESRLLFIAQCFKTESMQKIFLCHSCV